MPTESELEAGASHRQSMAAATTVCPGKLYIALAPPLAVLGPGQGPGQQST